MKNWATTVVTKYINVGTPLVLMGALWLYLWVFPWYPYYVNAPHWGHNYAEAAAFLVVGLAYFNRRIISDCLALIASLLVIPASLELLPHPVTAIAGGTLVALIILDMLVERKREKDLWQPSSQRLAFWLKGHLLRFAYVMLSHIAFTYFFVRLPAGTYETELVTHVFDAMSLVFFLIALLDGTVKKMGRISAPLLGFFWGMLTITVALVILSNQPETWICLTITLVATALGVAALFANRGAAGGSA
jgi:hypothetical protein